MPESSEQVSGGSFSQAATVSLENSDVNSLDTTSLQESIALELVYHIGRYDEVLRISYSKHEPHHLVQYLFVLSNILDLSIFSIYRIKLDLMLFSISFTHFTSYI